MLGALAEFGTAGCGVGLEFPPEKPVAYNNGLFSMHCGLLWGIVACYFGLLGFPGSSFFVFFLRFLLSLVLPLSLFFFFFFFKALV